MLNAECRVKCKMPNSSFGIVRHSAFGIRH